MDVVAASLGRPTPRVLPVAQLLGAAALFEIEMLRGGLRTLVRITAPRRQLGWIIDWLVGEGLAVRRWALDMLPRGERSLNGFSVAGRPICADSRTGASPVLFVAREPGALANVDALALDDFWQGLALGYPRCCIENFCRNAGSFVSGYSAYFVREKGPFPCWGNVLAEPFGHLLLSHLPCSPKCRESGDLARASLNLMLSSAPERALATLDGLRRVMVYHPEIGILSLRSGPEDPRVDRADAVMTGTWSRHFPGNSIDLAALPHGARIFDFRGNL